MRKTSWNDVYKHELLYNTLDTWKPKTQFKKLPYLIIYLYY